jgi:hypothetical protein
MEIRLGIATRFLALAMIIVAGASSWMASSAPARANYSCFTTVCGETWRNNHTSGNCLWVVGCYQGSWSGTYSSVGYRLLIEEHAEWYACYYGLWCYKSGWDPKNYLSSSPATSLSTAGANYDSQIQHRTWAYHSELTGTYNGNTSDGY